MKKWILIAVCLFASLSVSACDNASLTTNPVATTSTDVAVDTVAPVFFGSSVHAFAAGPSIDLSASALGITAVDDQDGDLSAFIGLSGSIDFSKPGEYEIVYTVTDSSGNTGTFPVTITLIDYSFKYSLSKESVDAYFEYRIEQTIGGNGLMLYKVVVDVKPGFAVSEMVSIRMNVLTNLGYRTTGSMDFANRTREEFLVLDLEKDVRTVTFEFSVRINAVEVQARPCQIEIVGATGEVKTE